MSRPQGRTGSAAAALGCGAARNSRPHPLAKRGLLPGPERRSLELRVLRRLWRHGLRRCRRAGPWWPGHAARHGGVPQRQRSVPVNPKCGCAGTESAAFADAAAGEAWAEAGAIMRKMSPPWRDPCAWTAPWISPWSWTRRSVHPPPASSRPDPCWREESGVPLHCGAGPPDLRHCQRGRAGRLPKAGSIRRIACQRARSPVRPACRAGRIPAGTRLDRRTVPPARVFPNPLRLPTALSRWGKRPGKPHRSDAAPGRRSTGIPKGDAGVEQTGRPDPAGAGRVEGVTSATTARNSAPGSPAPTSRPRTAS